MIIYGQTEVPANGVVDDPRPNTAGLEGEVERLPVYLPNGAGIDYITIEGTPAGKCAGLMPWLSDEADQPCTNERGLPTVASNGGSQQIDNLDWRIRGGKWLHVRLMNNALEPWVLGWSIQIWLPPS